MASKVVTSGLLWQKIAVVAAFVIPLSGVSLGLYSQQRVLTSQVEMLCQADEQHEAVPMHKGSIKEFSSVENRLRKIEVTQAIILTKLDMILRKVGDK